MQSDGELVPVMTRTPSMTGSEKAACIWKMASTGSLIVSIRGTASAADHMVNLNGTPKDASAMFVSGSVTGTNMYIGLLIDYRILATDRRSTPTGDSWLAQLSSAQQSCKMSSATCSPTR